MNEFFKNPNVKYAAIGAAAVAIVAFSSGAENVGSGVGAGATNAGTGIGIGAIILSVFAGIALL